jgi:hypothetical protein
MFLEAYEELPYLTDFNLHVGFKPEIELRSVLMVNESRFDSKKFNSWVKHVLEKESNETACVDFLIEIILLLMKCFRMRLYRDFDDIKYLMCSLMLKIESCQLEGAVLEKCLILFCRLFNLTHELLIQNVMQTALTSNHERLTIHKRSPILAEELFSEKLIEMGIRNIFDIIPIWKLLTKCEDKPLLDQVYDLKRDIQAAQKLDSKHDLRIEDLVSKLKSNDKVQLCDLVGDKIHNTIIKTIVRCGMTYSTLNRRYQSINLLDDSEYSTHLLVSHPLFTLWVLQWDIQNEDSQNKIAGILDEFAFRCCSCDDTSPTRMNVNHQNQRIFQKLSAHIYILQLLDNYIAYSSVSSFNVHANIQRCYTFLSYFCLDFAENQSVLHEHLQRLLQNLHRYPCDEAIYVIALIFKDQEICLNESITMVINAMSNQMIRAKDKNAVHILSRLALIHGDVNVSAKHCIAKFIRDRRHDLFVLLTLQQIEELSQKTHTNCNTQALIHLEYHAAIVKLVTCYSEINVCFIEENLNRRFHVKIFSLSWDLQMLSSNSN